MLVGLTVGFVELRELWEARSLELQFSIIVLHCVSEFMSSFVIILRRVRKLKLVRNSEIVNF